VAAGDAVTARWSEHPPGWPGWLPLDARVYSAEGSRVLDGGLEWVCVESGRPGIWEAHPAPVTAAGGMPQTGSRNGNLRIGDTERDTAMTRLRDHYAAGRLTTVEMVSRLDAALAARTQQQLDDLLADLPRPAPPFPPLYSPDLEMYPGLRPARRKTGALGVVLMMLGWTALLVPDEVFRVAMIVALVVYAVSRVVSR
jgi:hypothetical protein